MHVKLNYPHTLVVLCGPTRSGKTTFATKASKALRNEGYSVKHISSDAIRQELLQAEEHPHSARMMHVSQQAFDLLFAQTEAFMAYPVSTEFVFVDTRGYDVTFRQRLLDLAKKHNYSTAIVTFEYSTSDYLKGVSEEDRAVVEKDVAKFKRKCLPDLKRRDYHCALRVARKDDLLQDFSAEVTFEGDSKVAVDYETGKCVGDPSFTYAVVGDVHEQVNALQDVYHKVLSEDPNARFIIAGDWIDRGGQTKETVEFLYKRMLESQDVFVLGNHESYVYRRLNDLIDTPAPAEVENKYFTSLKVLQQDTALRTKFERIVRESVPFFKVDSRTASFIVTHAPCETKYLGKVDPVSRRSQRDFYIKDRNADVRENLGFIYNSISNFPVHIFGHLTHGSKTLKYRNNVLLDTGAVYGGMLSAMIWDATGYRYYQVPCSPGSWGPQPLQDLVAPAEKEFNIRDYELEDRDYALLNNLRNNGIKYISGTMAPAPSTATELEGVEAALAYFAKRHVYDVCVQPKYMGSRAQLYLHADDFNNPEGELTKSWFVSRSGWKIQHVPEATEKALRSFLKSGTLRKNLKTLGTWTTLILDGELLPWSVLGHGLIEKHFVPYQELVKDFLGTLRNDSAAQELQVFSENEIQERIGLADKFAQTLSLYSGEEEPTYKAFGILAKDGKAVELSSYNQFTLVNDDPVIYLDLREESFDASLSLAKSFFNERTIVEKMEGVVVKPCHWVDVLKSVPYMKVRNEAYLALVYGYDYTTTKYDQLCRQKNIALKASLSLKEAILAKEMLEATPELAQECAVKLISTVKGEASLDPRL